MHTWWTGKWEDVEQATPIMVHQQNLERRRQQRRRTKQAQQQDQPSKGTPFSRGSGNKHSATQPSTLSALAPKQTDVRTEQNTLMNLSTSQADLDARQGVIIQELVRLEVKGNRQILQVYPRATGLNTT